MLHLLIAIATSGLMTQSTESALRRIDSRQTSKTTKFGHNVIMIDPIS